MDDVADSPEMKLTIFRYFSFDNELAQLRSVEDRILAAFASGMSVVCDIIIVAALCYYLNSKRTGFTR